MHDAEELFNTNIAINEKIQVEKTIKQIAVHLENCLSYFNNLGRAVCFYDLIPMMQKAQNNVNWRSNEYARMKEKVRWSTLYVATSAMNILLSAMIDTNSKRFGSKYITQKWGLEQVHFFGQVKVLLYAYEADITRWRLDQVSRVAICEKELHFWKEFIKTCDLRVKRGGYNDEDNNDNNNFETLFSDIELGSIVNLMNNQVNNMSTSHHHDSKRSITRTHRFKFNKNVHPENKSSAKISNTVNSVRRHGGWIPNKTVIVVKHVPVKIMKNSNHSFFIEIANMFKNQTLLQKKRLLADEEDNIRYYGGNGYMEENVHHDVGESFPLSNVNLIGGQSPDFKIFSASVKDYVTSEIIFDEQYYIHRARATDVLFSYFKRKGSLQRYLYMKQIQFNMKIFNQITFGVLRAMLTVHLSDLNGNTMVTKIDLF